MRSNQKEFSMCNMGFLDRFLRVFVGGLLFAVAIFSGWVWGYIGLILIATGFVGICPVYLPFRINTGCKR
jgi:hypothetical protein